MSLRAFALALHLALAAAAATAEETAAPLRVDTPDTLFMFPAGQPAVLDLTRGSPVPAGAEVRAVVRTFDGREVAQQRHPLAEADGLSTRISVATADLPYGVYRVELSLTAEEVILAERRVDVGVCSDEVLPKAAPGEFLYGLDANLGQACYHRVDGVPVLLEWTRWMGADILRAGFNGWAQSFIKHDVEERLAQTEDAIAAYKAYDLRLVANVDPPDDKWAAHMERIDRLQPAFAEELARRHRGWLHYWEIGNEPDLPGFYEGPIERYATQYLALRAAIRRGDPEAQVMNGGFAYREDRETAFFAAIERDDIDLIAYHAHGPGVEAERDSYRRHAATAAAAGFGDIQLVDTETGLAAVTDEQELEKARTCIQKMVFAQSVGAPFLLWFRLHMGDRPYGSLRGSVQPRPVILAYRAMVAVLRGLHFERTLDTADHDLECHAFHRRDGVRRALVLWSNALGEARLVHLRLGVSAAEQVDLFGNRSPLAADRDGLITLGVGEDPVFVTWDATHDVAPAIDAGRFPGLEAVELRPGVEQDLVLAVRNPGSRPLEARLQLESAGPVAVRLSADSIPVALAPGERRAVTLRASVGALGDDLAWPSRWTVFPRIDPAAVDPSAFDRIPDALPGLDGAMVAGVGMTPREHHLDLAALTGYRRHQDTRAAALFMAEVHSPRDQTVVVGAAADWWMSWYHDGAPVFDTLESGNGAGYTILSHTFPLQLRQGRNLLAVRVLAGSHGWRLVVGGPHAVAEARGAVPEQRLQLRLIADADGELIATRTVPVRFRVPPRAWPGGGLDDVRAAAPDARLGGRHRTNRWEQVPGEQRWWGGDADCSADLWLRSDREALHVVAVVADQTHRPSDAGARAEDGDALVIAGAGSTEAVIRWQIGADGTAAGPGLQATVARDEDAGTTCYHAVISREALPGAARLNLRIHDRDAEVPKQFLQWRRGWDDDAQRQQWYPLHLEPEGR